MMTMRSARVRRSATSASDMMGTDFDMVGQCRGLSAVGKATYRQILMR